MSGTVQAIVARNQQDRSYVDFQIDAQDHFSVVLRDHREKPITCIHVCDATIENIDQMIYVLNRLKIHCPK